MNNASTKRFPKKLQINTELTQDVRVTLTPVAQRIARTQKRFSVSKTGSLTAPVWEIMRVFGPHLAFGAPRLFEDDQITIIKRERDERGCHR